MKFLPGATVAFFFSAVLCAGGAVWYPAEGWADKPDPVASPRARKGGLIRFNGGQGPKSYNAYIDNNTYTRMTFDLMYGALLTIDSETLDFKPYIACRWSVSDDGREFTFVIDPRARWSDGTRITAEDVKWTFDAVMDAKSDTGAWKTMLGVYESPHVAASDTVVFRKKGDSPKDWRDLIHCATFPIMPSGHFGGADFNRLDFIGAPVSGPYRLCRVEHEVECEYRRETGWWRADFPSSRGLFNFDRLIIRYFTDNENAFEALKKKRIDVYPVYTARIMNEGTRTKHFVRNWILKRRVRNQSPIGFQGFAMNMRRPPFDDVRTRKAMAKLMDRELMNRTMMNGEYFLLNSYYTDLYRPRTSCTNVLWSYDPEGAAKLLSEVGWRRNADGRLEKDGREFVFTFLSRSQGDDKFLSLFNSALRAQGITMKIDRKDFAGWMRDMDQYNFDMTWAAWGASLIRNPETMWKSSEGRNKGGNNVTGFADAEVDAIIEREKTMMTNAEREDAYRRIDALVCAQVPYILLWHTDEHRVLYWNKFGTPSSVLGRYGDEDGILAYWWFDVDKARELDEAMNANADSSEAFLPAVPLRVDFKTGAER
jgi:microcin C transport system substrate-binding protein